MREAGIHITQGHFVRLIEELQNRGVINIIYTHKVPKAQVWDEFFRLAALNPLNSRNLNVTNKKIEKKASRVVGTTKGDALLFSRILIMVRKNLHHRGVMMIHAASKEWPTVQLIAQHASNFCDEFGLKIEDGYREYIRLAIERMNNNYSLLKFPKLHEVICNAYGSLEEISQDPHKKTTKALLERYKHIIYEKVQVLDEAYLELPERYIFFVKAAAICVNKGVTPETYINAQFEALAFVDGIPDPAQLVGPKAGSRLAKYMYENSIKPVGVSKDNTSKVDFNKLKKLK